MWFQIPRVYIRVVEQLFPRVNISKPDSACRCRLTLEICCQFLNFLMKLPGGIHHCHIFTHFSSKTDTALDLLAKLFLWMYNYELGLKFLTQPLLISMRNQIIITSVTTQITFTLTQQSIYSPCAVPRGSN